MLFPALNCLQRGQVGLLVTYLVLLSCGWTRLGRSNVGWHCGRRRRGWRLAITVKLTPIMPATIPPGHGFGLPVVMGWNRRKLAPAATLLGGMMAGLVLFLLLLPAVTIGWGARYHLHRWVDLVVLNGERRW